MQKARKRTAERAPPRSHHFATRRPCARRLSREVRRARRAIDARRRATRSRARADAIDDDDDGRAID